jgi:hypothetical protein
MAEALADRAKSRRPLAIPNSFPAADLATIDGKTLDRRHDPADTLSLHWYSQTIGPGRGLEACFEALRGLDPASRLRLHLRGRLTDSGARWLTDASADVPEGWIQIHPTVPNAELLSRIAEHDVGLALEQREPRSRDLTITNKFFQYLQGGLALLATKTSGQAEAIAQSPGVGVLLRDDRSATLRKAIEHYLKDPEARQRAGTAAREAARGVHAFERVEPCLVERAVEAIQHS